MAIPPKSPAAALADPQPTLLDRVRQDGLVDELVDRMEIRLKLKRSRRRKTVRLSAAAAVAVLGLAWGLPWMRSTATFENPSAEKRTLALADGSTVELNGKGEIKTDFRYGRRQVQLVRGEAYFAVAKDRAHPFLVESAEGTVRVTGTHFDVRLAGSDQAEVTLFEGSVTVDTPAAAPAHLIPGQQLNFGSHVHNLHTLSESELSGATAWRKGKIVLNDITLADAAARLAAVHGCVITVAPAVASIHIGGTYPLGDLRGLMDALGATNAVRVEAHPDGSYRLLPP